jgi:micrococcal nuclease
MKSVHNFFILLIFVLGIAAQHNSNFIPVSKVVDGDTFWVRHPNGTEEKIRLIGINTPEARNTGRTQVEYFGKEATVFAKRILEGNRVRLEYDAQRYDRYKRTLAYVYLEDGTFFNALLVQEGYAQVSTYPPNVKHEATFLKLQREARTRKKGMWGR